MRGWQLAGEIVVRCYNVTPQEITAMTGLAPTKIIMAGSIARPGAAPAHSTMWYFKKDFKQVREPELVARAMLAELSAPIDFGPLHNQVAAWVEVVCYFDEVTPPLTFPADLLQELGRKGMGLHLDLIETVIDP